ncbi:MAG: hypothetical protein ACREC5_07765, partial [Thermoplasmata archaeon]
MPSSSVAPGPVTQRSAPFPDPLSDRLSEWVARAEGLAAEGVPIPVHQVPDLVERARTRGDLDRAEEILGSAERLLDRATRDWTLVRELLRRIDELKTLAARSGLDLTEFDARLGDPRAVLKDQRLSEALLERVMAIASKSLAVLNEVLPRYLLAQAQLLGRSIKAAEGRGEDVSE